MEYFGLKLGGVCRPVPQILNQKFRDVPLGGGGGRYLDRKDPSKRLGEPFCKEWRDLSQSLNRNGFGRFLQSNEQVKFMD